MDISVTMRGEHQHQRAEPVDAEVIFDAQRRGPGALLDEAHGSVGGQPVHTMRATVDGGQRRDHRHGARVPAREQRNHRADHGQHGQQRQ